MQTFDTHCASTKHMNKVNTQKQEQVKQLEQAEKVDLDSEKCSEEPPPPSNNKRRARSLKIEREVGLFQLYFYCRYLFQYNIHCTLYTYKTYNYT